MVNPQTRKIYFGILKETSQPTSQSATGTGDLRCKMQCFEWSDGRLGCPHKKVSTVQKSRKTERFIWYSDYVSEGMEMNESNKARDYDFRDLKEAYYQFLHSGELEEKRTVSLLLEIIQAYNDKYHRDSSGTGKKVPIEDFVFFIQSIIEIQKKGKDILPLSLKIELYREAGMFEKCFEINDTSGLNRDEKEIIDEVLFRAAHRDNKPFIIEQCEYYRNSIRLVKRFPCIISDC